MFSFIKRLFILPKRNSDDPLARIKVALFLKNNGSKNDLGVLYSLLKDSNWNVRNAGAQTIIDLVKRTPEVKKAVLDDLHDILQESSLGVKIAVLEILGKLKAYSSKPYLLNILEESGYDLQYAAIRAIGFLDDVDVLSSLSKVVYAKDYITRRAAILSVVRISNSVKEEKQLDALTPHIHLLFESYVELTELGEIIKKILDHGNPANFPKMKGYTEFEIIKLEVLLEEAPYRPEMYQNFSKLIFPVYFPVSKN